MSTTEAAARPARAKRKAPADRAGWRFAELFGLSGLAIAQPILDIYAKNPLELISRQVEGLAVVVFAVVVVVVPPAVLFGIEQLVGVVSAVWARRLHPVLLAVLAGVFVLQLIPADPVIGFVAVAVAIAAAVAFWFAVVRVASMHQWLRVLAVAPVVFAVMFLLSNGIAALAFESPPAAAAIAGDESPPSIVMVVLDELPTSSLLDGDGAIDAERFPNLAALAGDGTWYRNNATLGSWTSIAVPGILTGQYPDEVDNRAHWSTYPENLFTLLGDRYHVVAHESSTRLCPAAICPDASRPRTEAVGDLVTSASSLFAGLINPFHDVELAFEPAGADMTKTEAHQLALDTVDEVTSRDEPTLGYLHLSLPHQPWHFVASGQATDAPDPTPGLVDNRWVDDMAAASAYQRHLLQTEFADTVVGDVVERLEDAGRYDDTLVVVVADHGASFRSGADQRAISEQTIPDIAFPPLIVKAPGAHDGRVDDRPVQTIDVLPTVAGIAGVAIPWAVDGVDLRDDDPLTDRRRRYFPVWIDELPAGPDGASLPDTPLVDLIRASGRPVGSAGALDSLATEPGVAGRSVDDLAEGPTSGGRAVVHGGADLQALDPDAPLLPLFVDIELAQDEAGAIAVAVDGTVAVTGQAGGPGRRHLWAVIPPWRVTAGRNDITVYRVGGTEAAPELSPLDVTID